MAAGDQHAKDAAREADNRNGDVATAYALLAIRDVLVELLALAAAEQADG